jgi:hypothetical protein
MFRVDLAGSPAGQKSQKWSKAFAATAHGIDNIAFQRRIKSRRLLGNAHLNFFKIRLNQPPDVSQRAETYGARPS